MFGSRNCHSVSLYLLIITVTLLLKYANCQWPSRTRNTFNDIDETPTTRTQPPRSRPLIILAVIYPSTPNQKQEPTVLPVKTTGNSFRYRPEPQEVQDAIRPARPYVSENDLDYYYPNIRKANNGNELARQSVRHYTAESKLGLGKALSFKVPPRVSEGAVPTPAPAPTPSPIKPCPANETFNIRRNKCIRSN